MGITSSGDVAIIRGLKSGELSIYNYAWTGGKFRTFTVDVQSLGRLTVVNRLLDPIGSVIKSLPAQVTAKLPRFPKMEPKYHLNLQSDDQTTFMSAC
jgi:hypothetical protein